MATDPSALAGSTSAYPSEAMLELQAQCCFLFQNVAAVDLANLLEQGLSQESLIMFDIPTRITVTGLMQVAARNLKGPAHHSLFR